MNAVQTRVHKRLSWTPLYVPSQEIDHLYPHTGYDTGIDGCYPCEIPMCNYRAPADDHL